jgi:hypothetical protein
VESATQFPRISLLGNRVNRGNEATSARAGCQNLEENEIMPRL